LKSKRLVFRPAAEGDLVELYTYIAEASGNAHVAFSFIERLRAACFTLADFSERGAARNDIKEGLRIIIHERKTVIAYFVKGDSVMINNIFHAGRDWEAALLGGDNPPRLTELKRAILM
jgi:toxin ParE1/3/4